MCWCAGFEGWGLHFCHDEVNEVKAICNHRPPVHIFPFNIPFGVGADMIFFVKAFGLGVKKAQNIPPWIYPLGFWVESRESVFRGAETWKAPSTGVEHGRHKGGGYLPPLKNGLCPKMSGDFTICPQEIRKYEVHRCFYQLPALCCH